jgi:photosystem II stability/assembly factor-like uncharacterized protein
MCSACRRSNPVRNFEAVNNKAVRHAIVKWIGIVRCCVILAMAGVASAQSLTSPQTVKVTSVSGSNSKTNGYVLFTTAQVISGCEAGFWSPTSDPVFSSVLEAATAALGHGSTLVVTADRGQLWPQTAEKYCRIVRLG